VKAITRPSSGPHNTSRRARTEFAAIAAALLFVSVARLFPWSKPGLQYDEALLVRDAVKILVGPAAPSFTPPSASSWIRLRSRSLPIMDLPYIGAMKPYLALLPFAIFGSHAIVVRAVSVFLAAFGVWALVRTLSREISLGVGASVGLLLAVHPAILDQTIYDNSLVAVWMAMLGLVGVAFSAFRRSRSRFSAVLLGLSLGLAVWARLNFLWLIGATAVSAAVCARGCGTVLRKSWRSLAAGFAIGCSPLILFEVLSRGATLRFMRAASPNRGPWFRRVAARLPSFAETLLSDSEHRGIWNGPLLPTWQIAFTVTLVLVGVGAALLLPKLASESEDKCAWRKGSALTLCLFALVMAGSRLNVSEHHLVTAVPVAAVATVLGIRRIASSSKAAKVGFAVAGAAFVALCLLWDVRSAIGIRSTGGVRHWSEAIEDVAATLRTEAPGATARVFSWGLGDNIFVLTGGAVAPREEFWEMNARGEGMNCGDVVGRGGYFLIGPSTTEVARAVRSCLTGFRGRSRKWTFREGSGAIYAELFRISPATSGNR